MRKYRSYIFLGLLLIVFLAVGYFFLSGKTKKVEIVEINFVSDHAVTANVNELIPESIITFATCYIENDSIDYISRISFKRIDINDNNADSLVYSKTIDKNLKINEAQEMFTNQNKSLKSTVRMSKQTVGFKSGYKDDTLKTRYFYLVGENDPNVRLYPTIYFNNHEELKKYINKELKSGTLFKGKKENKVTILLLKGTSSPNPGGGPEPVPHEPDGGGGPVAGNPPGTPTNSEWTQFNKKEQNLLNNGYKEGDGDIEDLHKTLSDPDGETHYYYKKKAAEKKFISAYFSKNGQNKVKWSNDLTENAEKITIVFDNGFKKYTDDVTNQTSYVFKSGDKDFDGVECTVTLVIVLKPNVKLLDKSKTTLKLITTC